MLCYRYAPLQDNNYVRLLVLHPSLNGSDPIRCTIQHARLFDAFLEYKAVSYTWGNPIQTQEICFKDSKRKLFVGENCYNALQHLRLQREDRLLWIDAICINQENPAERASQVRIMDKIFGRASEVIVFLGKELQYSRSLFGELAAAEELINDDRDLDLPFPERAIICELENLFRHPWFKRVWVIQEVCAKSSVTIMCGCASTSFDALRSLYFGYQHNTAVTADHWPLPLEWIYRHPKELATPELTLWHRLYSSRDCQATDPRDRVFALKSLVGSRQPKMDFLVNYTQSVEDCFTQIGQFLLPVLGLRLLTAVRHTHNLKMPSWIPDWSQNHPLNHLFFFLPEAENGVSGAAIDQDASCLESPGQPTDGRQYYVSGKGSECMELLVKGCQYARMKERSQVFSFVDLEDAGKQMKRLYHSLVNLKQFFDNKDMSDVSIVSNYLGRSILDAMSIIDGYQLHEHLSRDHCCVRVAEDYTFFDSHNIKSFFNALQECRVGLLDNGELIIVPAAIQCGDVICILHGSASPCALRVDQGGKWILVSGDCHIFEEELLDGESILLSEEYLASNKEHVETFRLR